MAAVKCKSRPSLLRMVPSLSATSARKCSKKGSAGLDLPLRSLRNASRHTSSISSKDKGRATVLPLRKSKWSLTQAVVKSAPWINTCHPVALRNTTSLETGKPRLKWMQWSNCHRPIWPLLNHRLILWSPEGPAPLNGRKFRSIPCRWSRSNLRNTHPPSSTPSI